MEWSTEDVCCWLRHLDLRQHCDAFTAHDIRGRELLALARHDFKVTSAATADSVSYLTERSRRVCRWRHDNEDEHQSCIVVIL